jgi:N-acetylmuramoyl-L-alanine amidase
MNIVASTYVHALEGRLRIKLAEVKGSAVKAREVEGQIQQFAGVEYVWANSTTGNVLILYNSRFVEQREILAFLTELGYLSQAAEGSGIIDSASMERMITGVAATIMEIALSRLVVALI